MPEKKEQTQKRYQTKKLYKQKLQRRGQKVNEVKAIGKLNPYDIILSPLVNTEKGHSFMEQGKYIFKVHKDSNKNDVKQAIKTIYNKDIESVNIVNMPYKGRSNRKLVRRAYKKAIVTLKKGEKLELVK